MDGRTDWLRESGLGFKWGGLKERFVDLPCFFVDLPENLCGCGLDAF